MLKEVPSFNVSYSAYSVFKQSPLQFYFQYIARSNKSDPVCESYGKAGNVVHNAIETWIKQRNNTFDTQWSTFMTKTSLGLNGVQLNKNDYRNMAIIGIKYYNSNIHNDTNLIQVCTEKQVLFFFSGYHFKGYIDLYCKNKAGQVNLYDWKTNSTSTKGLHRDQRLFYSWLIWKTEGIIPCTKWLYLRNNTIQEDNFTVSDMESFEIELLNFLSFIKNNVNNITAFTAKDWQNPFNAYYSLCRSELARRNKTDEIVLNIRGHYVFIESHIPDQLVDGLDYATKFDLPDKFFMQEHAKKHKKGFIKLSDIGTVHLFNKKHNCFPIGLLDKVTQVINDYIEYYKKPIKVILTDSRDKKVLTTTCNIMPEKLLSNDKELRYYQNAAIDCFLTKKYGILHLPTGSGKTFTAAEILRRVDTKTLWIIDRKELFDQTKQTLEALLGIKIGIINQNVDLRDVTIATIQSLNSKLLDLQSYLYNVNFVIIDEFHKSAAESYQKVFAKLPNNKYRLGLTATVDRDDGKTPILHSILGEVIYSIDSQELVSKGYLVLPKITFHKVSKSLYRADDYKDAYNTFIINNDERNKLISKYNILNKKILILTNYVIHGKILQRIMPGSKHLHGSVDKKSRELIMQDFRDNKFNVLIGTLSIFSEGIDIPDLEIIINAAANKGDVKSTQVLGRVMRPFLNKTTAEYVDFADKGQFVYGHSLTRQKLFKKLGYEIDYL